MYTMKDLFICFRILRLRIVHIIIVSRKCFV